MVSYKELGLVNTREMFAKAIDGGYAIPGMCRDQVASDSASFERRAQLC